VNLRRTTSALMSALGTAFATVFGNARATPRIELAPGDLAPEFALAASDGRTYRLSQLRGRWVVIAWFPKAFTRGCSAECVSIGSRRTALQGFDASVFAASCDSVDTNRAFAAATGIDVPILSDPGAAVARAYGVLGPYGLPSRWTVYIGPDGRLRLVDREVRAGSHGADIVSALERLGVSRRS
jgi:peroxiredoxin Q/BCP